MTGVGDRPVTFEGYIRTTDKKTTALERQLSTQGAVDLTSRIYAGIGIDIDGTGSIADPYVITNAMPYRYLPDVQSSVGPNGTITAAAATWNAWAGWSALSITPDYPLWMRAVFTAMPSASTGYVAIGVELSGGVTNIPTTDPITGTTNAWGQSPFGLATTQQAITGEKIFKAPAGVATVVTPQVIRSLGTGTQQLTYPILRLVPLYWAKP